MTVLHSRNADAADAKAAADAKDATDPEQNRGQAATAETGLRDELGRYAELGAFTLTAGTHAWYAAVDTVATPEDARAASTTLAELRGSDLQQTWEAVTTLAADAKVEVPGSVAVAALFAETLQRVHQTSAILIAAAYDADLDALVAATADRAWRRENGVKLSFLRARGLRKQAAALVAGGRKARPEELHEALASAKIERRAWAVLAPSGALPVPPADGPLAERTAAAFESIGTGLRDLARLLPEHDLDALPFPELIDLVERLAADEGTLYRLPTIRSLRTSLEEAGLADLLAELAAARADRRAAEAAYGARQALAGGQRDGLTATEETPAEETPAAEAFVEETAAEEAAIEAEAETDVEPVAESKEEVETETESVEAAAADEVTEPKVEAEAEAEAEVEVEVEVDEITAEEPAEARPAVVSLPAPSPAADDLVDAAPAVPAQVEAEPVLVEDDRSEDAEPVAEVEVAEIAEVEVPLVEEVAPEAAPVVESEVAESEAVAEPESVAVAEESVVEEPVAEVEVPLVEEVAPEAAPVAESDAVESEVAESEAAAEPESVPVVEELVVDEPVADEPVAEVMVEEAAPEVVESEPVVEAAPVAESEPVQSEVAEPVAAVEVVEPVVEPESVPVVEAPVAEPEVAEVEATAVVESAEAEPVAEAVEPVAEVAEPAEAVAAGLPEKPDFTPGRPVTAYSADELLAVVRWLDGDGVERSDEELLRAAMKELGFARLGPRIKEALGAAVTAARG
ncbi:hypothetical protein [Kitasatospora sp. NPDC050463]|uniref:hypothetical protein n=1 Tax=Kitasatospora sp. NPDC050463 TaxID=3155786 RepID=UPI0034077516